MTGQLIRGCLYFLLRFKDSLAWLICTETRKRHRRHVYVYWKKGACKGKKKMSASTYWIWSYFRRFYDCKQKLTVGNKGESMFSGAKNWKIAFLILIFLLRFIIVLNLLFFFVFFQRFYWFSFEVWLWLYDERTAMAVNNEWFSIQWVSPR